MSRGAELEPGEVAGQSAWQDAGRALRLVGDRLEAARRKRAAGTRFRAAGPGAFLAALLLETERGALFLCVPVLLGLGAVLYFKAPFEPGFVLLLPAFAGCLAAAILVRERRPAFLPLMALTICLGGVTAGKVETWRHSTRVLGAEVTTRLSGRVARIDRLAAGRVRMTLDVLQTTRPTLRFAPTRVRVTAARLPEPVQAGDVVEGLVRLMPPSGPAMPGGYDFSFQSYFDGIGASGFFLGKPAVEPRSHSTESVKGWVENARDAIAQRVRSRIGGAEGEIAAALIVGVRGGIPEPVNEALRRTGLAHVLSISGLHMALVAATVMGGARALLASFPGIASRRPVKKLAAAAALLFVSLYLAFSGADVAAVRSFLMLAVMLTAVLFDRAALSVRNLAIAATIILLLWPHEVLGPSFQMSFAATGALVAAYAAWAEFRGRRRRSTMPARLALPLRAVRHGGASAFALAATSVIAGLATAAFGIYHFQRVSPLSLPANLATMPIVSVLVMPFALLAVLAMPFGLDGPFLAVMGFGLHWMIAVTQWFSARSPVDAVGAIPAYSLVLAIAALLVLTIATTALRLLALPLAAAAFLAAFTGRPAQVFVSEDAQLVGVVLGDGRLAVNKAKGGGFTLENWMHASAATAVLRPVRNAPAHEPAARGRGDADRDRTPRFRCDAALCKLEIEPGLIVAHAETLEAATAGCKEALRLLVVGEAASPPCSGRATPAVILTKRSLALRGSATLSLGPGAGSVAFAVQPSLRPWHAHRQFSRAARGLPARKPFGERGAAKTKQKQTEPESRP